MTSSASESFELGRAALVASGELARRAGVLRDILASCHVCPRQCRIDRLGGELGYCRTGATAVVAAAGPDFDEEACLSGEYGTGTVVFDSANLRGTSVAERESIPDEWPARWRKQFVHARELGDILLELQNEECHSIHFVSPSHVVPQMVAGILDATQRGLTVPIVYNSNAYDAPDILALLEGVVDVYAAKVRFTEPAAARRHLRVDNYVEFSRQSVLEMKRQVGGLAIDSEGVATRGLIVRFYVRPDALDSARDWLEWLAQTAGTDVAISVRLAPPLKGGGSAPTPWPPSERNYDDALDLCARIGFQNVLIPGL